MKLQQNTGFLSWLSSAEKVSHIENLYKFNSNKILIQQLVNCAINQYLIGQLINF